MLGLLVVAVFFTAPTAGDTAPDSDPDSPADPAAVADSDPAAADDGSPGQAEASDESAATEPGPDESADESDETDPDEMLPPATQPADVGEYVSRKIEKEGVFKFIWNIFFNIRGFLEKILGGLGSWAYLILWCILFMETGLVVMAFLPGDSLLFATGALAMWGTGDSRFPLNLYMLLPILIFGPILGDSCNYWIGRLFGHRIMSKEKNRFFKKSHIEKAHAFYARHGGKAVAIGRFLPLIRTFVPFVAGVGKMDYRRFLGFSVVGSVLWINICVLAGWAFGQQPVVKEHFETIIICIVLITLMPAIITFLRSRRTAKKQQKADTETP